ncbi:hypothetical protein NB689_003394 [Xanthomonas sacchari]|nr:hypothetical protein [Xanthomonas sacchari]
MLVDRGLARAGQGRVVGIAAGRAGVLGAGQGQGALQVVEQAVQVDRDDGGGADAGQGLAVAEPAAGIVPAALGAGAQVAVDLGGGAVLGLGGGAHVVQPGFRARRVAGVPIAVEQAAVGQPHHVRMRAARGQGLRAFHPVRVFLLQLRQIARVGGIALHLGLQLHHVREERRLRAAQVVGAVAVGDVPVGVDQVGEVVQHLPAAFVLAALHQAEHGEVGIPVVDLAEAPARYDVRVRQRQQAAVGRHVDLAAHQQRPQRVDVLAQAGVLTDRLGLHRAGFLEVGGDETAQVEARLLALRQIVGVDQRRVAQRQRVDEVLLVVEQLLLLHRLEQFRVGQVGRLRRRCRRGQRGRGRGLRHGGVGGAQQQAERQAQQRGATGRSGMAHVGSRAGCVRHGKRPKRRRGRAAGSGAWPTRSCPGGRAPPGSYR